MTFAIQRGSPRAPHAHRFAKELRKAMEKRQVGRVRLATAMGLKSHSIIAQWRSGNTLPRLDSARLLAEVLEWPTLWQLVEAGRTQTCARPSCDRTFVNESGGPRYFCSVRCRRIQETIDGSSSGRREADTLFREREEMRFAVRSFCFGCEPDGICQDADCALRPVSPLPLVELSEHRATTTATPYDRAAGLRALAAGADRARDARWHGEQGEENRRRQSERTEAWWAGLSDEERAEQSRRIGSGRSRTPGA